MFEPSDDAGERLAAYALVIPADGKVTNDFAVTPGQWQTLKFAWAENGTCSATLDDTGSTSLKARFPSPDGLCYLRLRSLAPAVDTDGFLIEFVSMTAR